MPASMKVKIAGVLHNSRDFYILNVRALESDVPVDDAHITAKGHVCGLVQLSVGATLQLHGEWVRHPKYGKQFQINGWAPWAPHGDAAAIFLHECVDGFLDYNLVTKITEHFEEGTFEALSHSPEAVMSLAVPDDEALVTTGAIRESTMQRALLSWERLRTVYELTALLQDQGLTSSSIQTVFARFGSEAKDIVSKNPYRLLEIQGFTFSQVDRIAARMDIPQNDIRRTQGAVLASIRQAGLDGHLFVRRSELGLLFGDLAYAAKVPRFDSRPSRVDAAVDALLEAKAVLLDTEVNGVYLPALYSFERESATKLAEFLTPVKLEVDPVAFLLDYQKSNRIDLSEAQQQSIEKLLSSRVLVLTGLPGTGKTTTLKATVGLFRAAGITFKLMAPTGIAAKRMSAVTATEAATIHRTFLYDGERWAYNNTNKFSVDAVIVDEMSMVDQELFFRILDALHPSTILVLVGDDAQLPSVGPGNVLRELIACPSVPNVRLTQIFRQSDTGGIVTNSHRINRGESLLLDEKDPTSEFRFVQVNDEERLAGLIVEMATKLKARDANFQVLSPKYDGPVGVNNLNNLLREKLNPDQGQSEWRAGTFHVREGDRVMVVQNDYKRSIYNGDMAKVMSFTKDDIVIKVHGLGAADIDVVVSIPKSEALSKLRLAYAITVHKSQGSEWENVILPIVRTQGRMLQRNLFYTAVTRAKKKVWLLGHPDAVGKAIANDMVIQRNTVFGRVVDEAFRLVVGVGRAVDEILSDSEGATAIADVPALVEESATAPG